MRNMGRVKGNGGISKMVFLRVNIIYALGRRVGKHASHIYYFRKKGRD